MTRLVAAPANGVAMVSKLLSTVMVAAAGKVSDVSSVMRMAPDPDAKVMLPALGVSKERR